MARADRHDDDDDTKSEEPRNSKNMLIIGASLLVAVASVTGGTILYMKSKSVDAAQPSEKETHVKRKGPPVIYALEPFVVNIRDNADTRYLKLKVEFGVVSEGKEVKAELDPYLPKLRDSILVLLTTKSLSDVQDLSGKTRLRQEIMTSASRILPRGSVKEVFFTDFVVQ